MPVENSGKFFASPVKQMVGSLIEQKTANLADEHKKFSAWNTIVKLSGGIDYIQVESADIKSYNTELKSA